MSKPGSNEIEDDFKSDDGWRDESVKANASRQER